MADAPNLTRDPIRPLIARVAIPAAVGNLFNVLFNVVDSWYAGQLSTDALAGLSLSFPLYFVFVVLGAALGASGGALVGNALGADDQSRASRWCYQLIALAMVCSGLIMVVGAVGTEPVFRFLGAEGAYLDAATTYMQTLYLGAPCLLLPFAINAGLTAQGKTQVFRNVLICGFFANLVLNPWFIYGGLGLPALGVRGIALATLLVQGCGAVYLWVHLRHSRLVQRFWCAALRPHPSMLKELVVQAIPLAASLGSIGVFFFLANAYINQFGAAAVAAYGIGLRIEQLVLVPAMAINHAALALISNNYGAGNTARVYESWKQSILLSALLLSVGGVLILAFGSTLMGMFSPDPSVVALGVGYLMVEAFALPAYAFIHTNGGVLQGVKRPQAVMWVGMARSLILPAVALPLLIDWAGFGLTAVWWMILVLAWLSAVVLHWHTARVLRERCGVE